MPVTVAPEDAITFMTADEFAAAVTTLFNAATEAVMLGAPLPPEVLPPVAASMAELLGKNTVITMWKALETARFSSRTIVTLTVLGSTPRDDATEAPRSAVFTAAGSPCICKLRVTVA